MLLKKMLRDLFNHKGAYLATMVLIMLGILVYTSFSMLADSFGFSIDKYYDELNFADGTIKVIGMPKDVADSISGLSGIHKVEGRLEERVRMVNYEREITFHFISYDSYDDNRLNDIELIGGRMPTPGENEIIMGNNYFMANNIKLGESVPVVVNGKKQNLKIVGYGRSPEFIYAKKNDAELISNPETFDIVFIPYETMSDMFGRGNRINNVAFSLYDGIGLEDVETDIKEVVKKYGLIKLTDRDDQVSHMTTIQKLEGIKVMTSFVPLMFLLVSAGIINIVLKRIVEQERTQIGVLKAFGISEYRILLHYMSYSLLISIAGGSVGMYLGLKSIKPFIDQLTLGFNMPFITSGLYERYFINSIIMCILFGLIAGYIGARKCLKLEAAEAMRPPVSKESKAGILDKLYFLIENFDIKVKLSLRNILRNKGRSMFVLFGIVITSALLTFPMAMQDIYKAMLLDQFGRVEIYDTKITLNAYMDREKAINDVLKREGIDNVEPQTQIPVTLYNKWKSKDTSLLAIPRESRLYRLYDGDTPVDMPSEGIVLGHWLARGLGAEIGDEIAIKSPLFKKDEYKYLKITKIVPQYIGSCGFITIENLPSFLDGQDIANALMISGSEEGLKRVSKLYNDATRVGSFDYREILAEELASFMDQTSSAISVLSVVGLIMGVAVIYVSIMISMAERHKELATLLVVGLRESEIHHILLMEQIIISIFGLLMGLPLGKAMLVAMAETSSTDIFVMPVIMPIKTYIASIALTIVAIMIPQIAARRKLGKIVVTEALNARE